MTLKTMTTAIALIVFPTLSFAMGCSLETHTTDTAMSCAEGTMMDNETGTCVPVVTG
ncbi:adenylosuccinate lyase [Ponticoccus sp. SC2-23]|uniref:adenylosuccinate lyase n=1 Tax=Alexandriicola marinus TaxID=2081710 RepID=UPI000FD80E5C|nr:adenylosuccinate lyase [Alexandriicola marinus]MBM1221787.1 adenylosuccinate lyase [Ponticoccus sp. SC6-9]MBM1226138.1 adenylosuccinate lyase [Ponticoccus sp. SC6-15]MBM1230734.1 adenylosuccinate lyase [Ponticoccus sp. SC6-38]MBM1235425.1 adenylosuccinate lyase [Ponticoccus sp. SC6-45]MBM1239756.1 adenylosuccinate lyase [Ponticoccus sp. SC6-49]MBM1243900.1 adenylosuccinate lyase [Ponticoccus sp. SC2-64]MBM1248949.1 adenylosuccinate lyase [Ponticoccus sp. SC6-42]MBM1253411.1 adenylosuccin